MREADRGSQIADRRGEPPLPAQDHGQSPRDPRSAIRDLHRATALLSILLAWCAFGADSPSTVRNDDSCDIMVAPAATLLLPYFDVDITNPAGETTLFTVTNVTHHPQVAHVTIWTDWSFPLLNFNIFLTGYDVQAINLYDVIARGLIAEPGTSSDGDVGYRSLPNDANPLLDVSNCDRLAVRIREPLLTDMRLALTEGRSMRCPSPVRVGGAHAHAIGYVTIDVVAGCITSFPSDPGHASTYLLYDNVLTGDYQQVNSTQNFAQGGPMVHIRAFPEGGAPGAKTTNLTRTFYGNYQNDGTADRRQPLPATFAARWIEGGAGDFQTTYKIWRQGGKVMGPCDLTSNSRIPTADIVRFDEEENPVTLDPDVISDPPFPVALPTFPSASRVRSSSSDFPPNPYQAVAGWMYMNLDSGLVFPAGEASQNWVVVSMAAEGRYSVDFDAALLGNGCSPAVAETDKDRDPPRIAPAPSANKTFAGGSPSTLNNDDSCDVMVTPAATLLLPYFEVDLASPLGETTLFTVTNVTQLPQIGHITLWTDWSFPVLSFDVFLTGYDVQSINLYDVIARGAIAPPGTSSHVDVGRRSLDNDQNPLLDIANCAALPAQLQPHLLAELKSAFTLGRTSACLTSPIGGAHARATGFLTIDLAQSCGGPLPTDPDYFTRNVLYDNVLIGDYQQVNSAQNFAQGNPLVHIRAIPEGGAPGAVATRFTRTFYSAYQNGGTADRRQPLPSTFAARWIGAGGPAFDTTFKIWREAFTPATSACLVAPNGRAELMEFVRFDELENPEVYIDGFDPPQPAHLPSSIRLNAVTGNELPPNLDDAISGWMYMNLDSQRAPQSQALQGWVVVSMAAEGRYSADFDAMTFGNGCTAAVTYTDDGRGSPPIGPGVNP
jgi:hypothetical protein